MLTLTSKEINTAYSKVNEIYSKNGRDTSLPVIVWVEDKEVQFTFDETVGSKGAWIISSDFNIEFEDDEPNYEEDRDYDYHL